MHRPRRRRLPSPLQFVSVFLSKGHVSLLARDLAGKNRAEWTEMFRIGKGLIDHMSARLNKSRTPRVLVFSQRNIFKKAPASLGRRIHLAWLLSGSIQLMDTRPTRRPYC